jgi:hypothetical protein
MLVGDMQVANRAFVALAVEAGIESVIKSLVPLAKDMNDLIMLIRSTLVQTNPALAMAINVQTLHAIVDYMERKGDSPVIRAERLPLLLDEDGPASTSAARDAGAASQVNITFSAPPAEYKAEIYLDGVFMKISEAAATDGWVNDYLSDVPEGSHTIRVLYRDPKGNITRFGQVVTVV